MMSAIKAIPIEAYPESAWRLVLGVSEADGGDALKAYQTIAVIHRAVKARAKAMRSMPVAIYRGARDISETEQGLMELRRLRPLLYLAESSICIYGAAYGLKSQGRLTGTPFLRWVSSSAMKPKFDDTGLVGIARTLGRTTRVLPLNQVWYYWLQDPAHDVGPDVAPVDVAAAAAGVLTNLDAFKAAYFASGAIRPTLLKVPVGTHETERKKLEAWYRRVASGIKNAFKAVAVGADVTAETIGDNLTDVLPEGLEMQSALDALVALEVPASQVLPDAANFATARQDRLTFLENTIIPGCEALLDSLNEQYYRDLGLELILLPERIPERAETELEMAKTVMALAGVPVLTQGEARQLIAREPLAPDAAEAERLELAAKLQLMQAATAAGYSTEDAAALVGLPAPTKEPPPPPPQLPPPAPDESENDDGPPIEDLSELARSLDMERWRRKAERRLHAGKRAACSFESHWIDPHDAALIRERLSHAESLQAVRAAFTLKAVGDGLSPAEQALWQALRQVFADVAPEVLKAIQAGQAVELAGLATGLQAALVPALVEAAMAVGEGLADAIGPDFDPAELATVAAEWAERHAGELAKGITDTTRDLVGRAVSTYQSTPGMTQEQLSAVLQSAFSPRRAETIAITEISRAASAATNAYQERLAAAGLTFERVWRTNRDESVCAICDPLNGKAERAWAEQYPDGPPAHTRCRCSTTLRRVRT
jgi:hypothetical protein